MTKRHYQVYKLKDHRNLQGILDAASRNTGYGISQMHFIEGQGLYLVIFMDQDSPKIIPSYKEIVIIGKAPQEIQDRINDIYGRDPAFYSYKSCPTPSGLLIVGRVRNPDAFPDLKEQLLKDHGDLFK